MSSSLLLDIVTVTVHSLQRLFVLTLPFCACSRDTTGNHCPLETRVLTVPILVFWRWSKLWLTMQCYSQNSSSSCRHLMFRSLPLVAGKQISMTPGGKMWHPLVLPPSNKSEVVSTCLEELLERVSLTHAWLTWSLGWESVHQKEMILNCLIIDQSFLCSSLSVHESPVTLNEWLYLYCFM